MYTIYKIKRFIWAQREFGKIMRKILNHICIAAISVSAAFLMTACVKDYGRDDIKKYIYEELGIKNISLSKEPEDVYDGEFHDKLWTVTDKDNNVDFHVLDDRTWGMESASNSLENDYYDEYFLKFYEDANIKSKYVEILREEERFLYGKTCKYRNSL